MSLDEMLSVEPRDYLVNGFIDADTEGFQERINGYYALAIAHQLKQESIRVDHLTEVIDQIELRPENLDVIRHKFELLGSSALVRLYESSLAWIHQPGQYSAFVEHVKRIRGHLALLYATPSKPA